MSSKIRSISLSDEEDDFIKEFNLSPSQLIKEKLWEMKGMIRKITGDKIQKLVLRVEELVEENKKLKDVWDKQKSD